MVRVNVCMCVRVVHVRARARVLCACACALVHAFACQYACMCVVCVCAYARVHVCTRMRIRVYAGLCGRINVILNVHAAFAPELNQCVRFNNRYHKLEAALLDPISHIAYTCTLVCIFIYF